MYLLNLYTAGYNIYRQLQNSEASGSKNKEKYFFFWIQPDKLKESIYVEKEEFLKLFLLLFGMRPFVCSSSCALKKILD